MFIFFIFFFISLSIQSSETEIYDFKIPDCAWRGWNMQIIENADDARQLARPGINRVNEWARRLILLLFASFVLLFMFA